MFGNLLKDSWCKTSLVCFFNFKINDGLLQKVCLREACCALSWLISKCRRKSNKKLYMKLKNISRKKIYLKLKYIYFKLKKKYLMIKNTPQIKKKYISN